MMKTILNLTKNKIANILMRLLFTNAELAHAAVSIISGVNNT
jgi:hypothetical protein